MYKKRLYIFIALSILSISFAISRLAFLQLAQRDHYRQLIEDAKNRGEYQVLPTVRGTIYDRNGLPLAIDRPSFCLFIQYELTRLMDDRFWEGTILWRTNKDNPRQEVEQELRDKFADDFKLLNKIIEKSAEIEGTDTETITNRIMSINNRVWNMRQHIAWGENCPDSELRKQNKAAGKSTSGPAARADFKKLVPDPDDRLLMTIKVDNSIMYKNWPLVELKDEEGKFKAVSELDDIENVLILPQSRREYPYGTAASQLIGWVSSNTDINEEIFAGDALSKFKDNEVSGQQGIEKVAEVILRGYRGEKQFDIDSNLIDYTPTRFGQDLTLTLDIELQARIESYLADPAKNAHHDKPIAAVLIDVESSQILALVSSPVFDLNTASQNYNEIAFGENKPLSNKAIYELYPPGSIIKPVISIIAIEEGKIKAGDVISCPDRNAPRGWPNCMQHAVYGGCHDYKWTNNTRNAIKGSCNIFFSHLADRIDSAVLQKWLYDFGYGRNVLLPPPFEQILEDKSRRKGTRRNLINSKGSISSPVNEINEITGLPRIAVWQKRMFGIGQGDFTVTPLQVANSMAVIARGGIFKYPMLYICDSQDHLLKKDLNVSPFTLRTVRDGMKAVIYEDGGTAYKPFVKQGEGEIFKSKGVTIYGKTGSTEPSNAWFTCFAEDDANRSVALVVLVAGGEHGGSDAGPIAKEILKYANEAGHIGSKPKPATPAQDN